MGTQGFYYDGATSARHPVRVSLQDGRLRVQGEGVSLDVPLARVRIAPRVGSIPRAIHLPKGAKCEIPDGPLSRRLETGEGRFFARVHRWESRLALALLALLGIAALVWGFLHFGVPLLARPAASAIPAVVERQAGKEGLALLDKGMLSPSALPEERRREMEILFRDVSQTLGLGEEVRLELRRSGRLGPNAFALPGGIVILSDELVELAGDDEEIAAVLAHEAGHVLRRHALRQVLQNSAAGLLIATLTGDIVSATSLSAAVPALLLNAKYSRDMEREADESARRYLDLRGLPRQRFADILLRIESARSRREGHSLTVSEYLSTHPDTRERLENFR